MRGDDVSGAVRMRLLDYGMIGLNGSVARPEPSANFADYQSSLANYQLKLNYRRRAAGQVVPDAVAHEGPSSASDREIEEQL